MNYEIAEDDEFPYQLTGLLWNHPVGLMIKSILSLLLVNAVNLESISTAGSVGFILIFTSVNYTGFKLSKTINGNKTIPLTDFILELAALIILIV